MAGLAQAEKLILIEEALLAETTFLVVKAFQVGAVSLVDENLAVVAQVAIEAASLVL